MELTWITFPIWVVLVSAGAYALAMYTKGDELRLNQVDLVDVDVQSGMARGTSWLNLFSPQSQTFDLGLAPARAVGATVADSQRLLSWLGTGGTRFGGGSGALFAGQYDFSPELDTLSHVPVQVWSTKGFLGRTTFPCREVPVANLVLAADGVPEGTIRNDLKVELSQCMLLSGSWAYLLADLKPGDTVRLRPGEQRDLKHVLRHPETWKASAAAASTPASRTEGSGIARGHAIFQGRRQRRDRQLDQLLRAVRRHVGFARSKSRHPGRIRSRAGRATYQCRPAAGWAERSALDGVSLCLSDQQGQARHSMTAHMHASHTNRKGSFTP